MPYLSVVMPVYNERAHIQEILRRVRAVPMDKEIICVDDCSRDGTWDILQQEGLVPGTRVVRHEVNGGKGAAVATGIGMVHGEVVIIQDADLEYDPADYLHLLEPIQRGETKVVYGSRFLGTRQSMSAANAMGNRLLTWCANLLFGSALTDMETCYKVFTVDIARRLNLVSKRWGIDPEITAKIIRMGYRIPELPISYHGRSFEEGKTIRWHDGFSVLLTLLRFRFLP
ncbi:MAG: glycosyltransferase family 2 protein [Dehalococcoidia bacterium]|nr:glycosyltransferase family 2 protein [Dehalococcoidia bacterium]